MRITRVRTRVVEWRGPTVPMQAHFCTNPMDLVAEAADSMTPFCFHGWLLVELFTDAGFVGRGAGWRRRAGGCSFWPAAIQR